MPKEPQELSFEQIVKALTGYLQLVKPEIVERFQFSKREQEELESINAMEFIKRATTCKFGNFLQEALRNRFVSG